MGQIKLVREGQQTTQNKLQSLIIGASASGLSEEQRKANYEEFKKELKKEPIPFEDISADELAERNLA